MPVKYLLVLPVLLLTVLSIAEERVSQAELSKDFWAWFDEFAMEDGAVMDPMAFDETTRLLERTAETEITEKSDASARHDTAE